MIRSVHFSAECRPQPKPRPRAVRRGGFVTVYTPKTCVKYETMLARANPAPADWPKEANFKVFVDFVFPTPAAERKKRPGVFPHAKRPDLDNLAKSFMDALQRPECGLLKDDSSVVTIQANKLYSDGVGDNLKPGVYADIYALTEE